jgi:hypothetical protein
MPTILDSLLVRLGFSIDPKGLEGFAKMADQAKGMALGIGGAISGAVYGIEHMVKSAAERLGGIQNFSEQMGISARSVDALGKVARENDSSLEAMEGALRSLTSMAGQAAMGVGRGRMLFQRFGISVKDANGHVKSTEELLGDVADRISKLPTFAQRNALGSRLGFDPATIKLLSEGRANFDRLRAEAMAANPFAEQDYANADATEKLFRKAGDSVTKLKTRIAVALMPTVNDLLKRFIEWTKSSDNIAKIQHVIEKVVVVAKLLWEHSGKILAIFGLFYAHKYGAMFMEWGTKIAGIATKLKTGAGAAEALKAGFGGLKGVLAGGLLGAMALLIEDLMTFEKGGNSVTGWMVNKFPGGIDVMRAAIAGLGVAAASLMTGSGGLGIIIVGFAAWIVAIRRISKDWNLLCSGIRDELDKIGNHPVFQALNRVKKFLGSGQTMTGTGNVTEEDVSALEKKSGKSFGELLAESAAARKNKNTITEEIPFGAGVLAENAQAWTMFPKPQSVVTNQEITFHIDGSHDPKAVAAEVEKFMLKMSKLPPPDLDRKNRDRTRNGQTAVE